MRDLVCGSDLRIEICVSQDNQRPTDRLGSQFLIICGNCCRSLIPHAMRSDLDDAISYAVTRCLEAVPRVDLARTDDELSAYFWKLAARSAFNSKRQIANRKRYADRLRSESAPDRHYRK